MLETNGNLQKTALETVKYKVHRGLPEPHPSLPPMLRKPRTCRG